MLRHPVGGAGRFPLPEDEEAGGLTAAGQLDRHEVRQDLLQQGQRRRNLCPRHLDRLARLWVILPQREGLQPLDQVRRLNALPGPGVVLPVDAGGQGYTGTR